MCIGIYFVDKEIVQHCSVSQMWDATRQRQKVEKILFCFVWVSGCPHSSLLETK